MIKNYLKIAWRNLIKNTMYSAINIGGLAVGMAVAILISFWIWDEVSFNKSFKNYDHIVQVIQNSNDGTEVQTYRTISIPAALELRNKYTGDFKKLALAKESNHVFAFGDKKIGDNGLYAEPELADILSLKMIKGSLQGIGAPSSIIIGESLAKSIFGNTYPINKVIRIDNKDIVKVIGVYEDFAHNSEFYKINYIQSWAHLVAERIWVKKAYEEWNNNSFYLYGQLAEGANVNLVSAKIKNLLVGKPDRYDKPEIFLQPMSRWHLYSEFKAGENTGGTIQYVWMFGLIGIFVLLLACINFMNLSTARSQKRAKEVGVRKAVGSVRKQLVFQFLTESVMIAFMALSLAILMAQIALPYFNQLADKNLHIPLYNPIFWLLILSFTLFTGLISGSYPAFYLSSFSPLKVLKGTFKVGRWAAVPRRVLVVLQFSVSVSLIIGTVVVFQQIQYAKNRPLGYDKNGLITIYMNTPDLYGKYEVLRNELINSGTAINMAEASNPATGVNSHLIGFEWPGKDPDVNTSFSVSWITHDFGKTVGWQFLNGRDFSRSFATDTSGMILNEAAISYMGLKNPIGKTVTFDGVPFHIVGVVKNVVMESPYEQAAPTVFMMNYENVGVITIKLNPALGVRKALSNVEAIFKKYNPSSPFSYSFVDEDYATKFAAEQRIGSLATFFAVFAILISCLGIFGLASFMAEQRTKEIGVRKVLGATVLNLWGLLSKDFVILVSISLVIAIPVSWYFMHNWLLSYAYHTTISIWIFIITATSVIFITLMTVSFQALKAALANPVKSLRTE